MKHITFHEQVSLWSMDFVNFSLGLVCELSMLIYDAVEMMS